VGVEAEVGIAVERRDWAGARLSREETIRLSKLTRGWEVELGELRSESSQEKVMFSMSWWRDSLAEIGLWRTESHCIDSAIATAAVKK